MRSWALSGEGLVSNVLSEWGREGEKLIQNCKSTFKRMVKKELE